MAAKPDGTRYCRAVGRSLFSRGARPAWTVLPGAYRSFLGLYWMTAPLAWLYAIPVERLLSAGEATRANLWLLAIVAAWRVALMVRVVSVLYGAKAWEAVCVVMLFADALALVILRLTPLPVFSLMGGIRLSESEQMGDHTVGQGYLEPHQRHPADSV